MVRLTTVAPRARRGYGVELVEYQYGRGLALGLLEEIGYLLLRAVYVYRPEVAGIDDLVVETRLLGGLLGNECLATPRCAIEQYAVGGRDVILSGHLAVAQYVYEIAAQCRLQGFHTRHVVECATPTGHGCGRCRGVLHGAARCDGPCLRGLASR